MPINAAPARTAARFSNDAAGFRKLMAWIGPETNRVVRADRPLALRLRGGASRRRGCSLRDQPVPGVLLRQIAKGARQDGSLPAHLRRWRPWLFDLRPTRTMSRVRRDLAELQIVRDALVGHLSATLNRGDAGASVKF